MSQEDTLFRFRTDSETIELARALEEGWQDQLAVLRASGAPLMAADADAEVVDDTADEAGDDAAATDDGGEKTFDQAYVRKLRRENAEARKRAQEAETRAKEYEDRDKTESERLAEQAKTATERAEAAETRLLRLEVAANKGVPAKLAKFLTGSTKKELEQAADELLQEIGQQQRTTFDGGARETATTTTDMDTAIRRAAGRA